MLVVVMLACQAQPGWEVPGMDSKSLQGPRPVPLAGAFTPLGPTAPPPGARGVSLSKHPGPDTLPNDPPAPPPLVARLEVDVDSGEFPLVVSFDATGSDLGSGAVSYAWDFGDGVVATEQGEAEHTYIGEGEFEATVTLADEGTGAASTAQITIEVDRPDCPREDSPVEWGRVDDRGLDSVSGMVASRIDPEALWIHEDRHGARSELTAIDPDGDTLGEYDLDDSLDDFEDLDAAVDPATGVSWLFLGDIGDNVGNRDEVAVWVVEEPDPRADGDLEGLRMELEYPDGPHDAETLIVDPLTFDLFIVTKESSGEANVYVKRAPHDDEGPFELDRIGSPWTLDLTATSGSVSPDGFRVVVRDYSDTARMFIRDGYEPFEDALYDSYCNIDIHAEVQGEAISFTADGTGILTTSEGVSPALYYVEL